MKFKIGTKNLPRKNQETYSCNMRNELRDQDLSLLSAEMLKLYLKIWLEEHSSDVLEFIRFKDDTSGGPYMPSCIFKFGSGELTVTNSAYGTTYVINVGPKHRRINNPREDY